MDCRHLKWEVDQEDRRFKICDDCGKEEWRSDEELIKDAGLDKEGSEGGD
jgi:hypothetical protein